MEDLTKEKYGYCTSDLKYHSAKNIIIKCDYCQDIVEKSYQCINIGRITINKDSCCKCKSKKISEVLKIKYSDGKLSYSRRNPIKIGEVFHYLTVIKETEYIRNVKSNIIEPFNECLCKCGKRRKIRQRNLKCRSTLSCGCFKKECNKKPKNANGLSKSKIYKMWFSMKCRCYNSKNDSYKTYGGKGIIVCNEWHDFKIFHGWATKNGYKEGLCLDRVNSDKNYCPENCEWVTPSENGKRVTSSLKDKIKLLQNENNRLKSILINNNISFDVLQ